MDNGGSSACKMWLENVEVFVNSSSSADEHKSSNVRKQPISRVRICMHDVEQHRYAGGLLMW